MKNKKLFLRLITLCFIITGCISNNVLGMENKMVPKLTDGFSVITRINNDNIEDTSTFIFDITKIPEYSGVPFVEINNNIPTLTIEEYPKESFERYSELDLLRRCGVALANVSKDTMPTEERGSIGMIKPSGWHTVKYDIVDGKYLYNRCHLIGYQLSGENANEKNLITGTRYMNMEGMLPFENAIADYINQTNNHVLYRVTPIFKSTELLARGVLLEAMSVEDKGQGLMFNVFCYNVQPGIVIDYQNGESKLDATYVPPSSVSQYQILAQAKDTYICNINTKKFHWPNCSSVFDIKEANKKIYTGNRESLISNGYTACKRCHP